MQHACLQMGVGCSIGATLISAAFVSLATVTWARSSDAQWEVVDVVLRLLAASVVYKVILCHWIPVDGALINAASFAYLMEQCQSLEAVTLQNLEMDENHCRVLVAYSRSDLEIELIHCKFTGAGASALAEVLGRNQGLTRLDYCEIDNIVLANGLRGNSSLESFSPYFSKDLDIRSQQLLAIAEVIRENKGLIEWRLRSDGIIVMNDEAWSAVCDSLKTHPTLEVLDLSTMVQALLGMMEVNTSILTIDLRRQHRVHELFRQSVATYLETNPFRLDVRAIKKTFPIPYRAKVLGRALYAARNNPNRLWMLLSGNDKVAFQ
jgi:hypothetical protein